MVSEYTLIVYFLCLSSGCNLAEISTPQVRAMDPAIERARHDRHDPLPLGDLGPDTLSRGRDYGTPRSYPRRSQENYSKTIDPTRSQYIPPPQVGVRQYPDIVKE